MTPSSSTAKPSSGDSKSNEHCGRVAAVALGAQVDTPPPTAAQAGDSHFKWLRAYRYWLCSVYLRCTSVT
jgi:hypothetical protein